MKIEFTGRRMEVTPKLRALAERKLGKLDRVLKGVTQMRVLFSLDRTGAGVEVKITTKNRSLVAEALAVDHGAALLMVADKLTEQAKRHVGKLQERRRRAPERGIVVAPPPPPPGPRVIKTRRFVPKPMTVDEAALEVGDGAAGFLVFRDSATEKVNVLYRRKDGNLGLIEPEN
jgi:putative sigma-54 modulation protein